MREALGQSANKYSRGVVAVAAGSKKFPGAALLTVGGARRGNAGYVKFVSEDGWLKDLVVSSYPDVVPVADLDGERVDAVVLGPGLGTRPHLPEKIPLVLDSESIKIAFERGFTGRHPISVITPHEGELRFCGLDVEKTLNHDQRKEIAHRIAVENDLIVVLKGHRTVIANTDGEHFVDEISGPELATAGSGDLLAGLIGSMLVALKDGGSAFDLVCRAVTLHSHAGRYAKEQYTSVTSMEILDSLRFV